MKDKLLSILAEQIGVEPEDLELTDSLRDDLHMNSSELSELTGTLETQGFGIVDFTEIDTVEDLLESLNVEEL